MKTSAIAGSLLAGLVLIVSPLHSQQVSGDVAVRGGPVAGHVVLGEGYSTYHRPTPVYRRPPARRVVVERYSPRVIVVERFRHHQEKYWKRNGYRQVVVYYLGGRFYDRLDSRHPGVREVVVYERNGRFYRDY